MSSQSSKEERQVDSYCCRMARTGSKDKVMLKTHYFRRQAEKWTTGQLGRTSKARRNDIYMGSGI